MFAGPVMMGVADFSPRRACPTSICVDHPGLRGCRGYAGFLDHSPDCNPSLDQSPDCNLDSDRDQGYDWSHEEATVQAGRATGRGERGGAAPGPGTSAGGHRRTDWLSSRNAVLPLLWPRRPGRVPTGREPARGGRDNRARHHNPPATRRPAALSDNRARRVPRGAARSMRRPALLRRSHRTIRNPHGREGRDARRATSKAPRRGRRHRPLPEPRHTRSQISAGTDRPTRQERRTRLNKRAPTRPKGRTRYPTTDNRTGPSAFETTRSRVRSPPPRHGPGLEPTSATHETIRPMLDQLVLVQHTRQCDGSSGGQATPRESSAILTVQP